MKNLLILLFTTLAFCSNSFGQGEPSAAEIAEQFANPTTAPASMNHNFDFTGFGGDIPGSF